MSADSSNQANRCEELVTAWIQGPVSLEANTWLREQGIQGLEPALVLCCLNWVDHILRNGPVLGSTERSALDQIHRLLDALTTQNLPDDLICKLVEAEGALTLDAAFALAKQYVERQGFTPAIVKALKTLAKRSAHYTGAQHFRKQVDGFLLRATAGERPKRGGCWGDYVRWSVGQLEAASRPQWEALIQRVNVHNQSEPPKTWIRQATPVFARIGADEFHLRMKEWFGELATGGPYGLTTPGSYLLRTLIWCFVIEPADITLQSLVVTALANGNWKKTKTLESPMGPLAKVATAAAYVVSMGPPEQALPLLKTLDDRFGYPDGKVRERYLEAARAMGETITPANRPNPYATLLQTVRENLATKLQFSVAIGNAGLTRGTDHLRVNGDLDQYLVSLDGRRIVRISDGATLTLTQCAEPEQLAAELLRSEASYYLRFGSKS